MPQTTVQQDIETEEVAGNRPLGSSTSPPGHIRVAKPLEHPSAVKGSKRDKRALAHDEACDSMLDQSESSQVDATQQLPSVPSTQTPGVVYSNDTPVLSFAQADESLSVDDGEDKASIPADGGTALIGQLSKGGSPARDVLPATPLPSKRHKPVTEAVSAPSTEHDAPLGSIIKGVTTVLAAAGASCWLVSLRFEFMS
jgi:hypothetical protein